MTSDERGELSGEQGELSVEAPIEFADLRVLNADFEEVASGVGGIERIPLDPGIYRVRARVPGDSDERLVTILPNEPTNVTDFTLTVDSLAPLEGTPSTPLEHISSAETLSREARTSVGRKANASLFLFIIGKAEHIRPDFTIRTLDRRLMVQFEGTGKINREAGWAGLAIDLPAGTYVIEHESPLLGIRGQAVHTEAGWTTEIFTDWDVDGSPHFANATAFLRFSGSGAFSRDSTSDYQRTDAALHGLIDERFVLSAEDEKDFFTGKFENPMLGLIAAYAALRRDPPNYDQLGEVVNNLRRMLPNSPDVRIISKIVELRGRPLGEAKPEEFRSPPMFAAGTDYVMQLAATFSRVIPENSPLFYIALSRTSGSVWTRWSLDTSPGDDPIGSYDQQIAQLRDRIRQVSSSRDENNADWRRSIAEQYALPQSVVRRAFPSRKRSRGHGKGSEN